jgi:hypothetical protein
MARALAVVLGSAEAVLVRASGLASGSVPGPGGAAGDGAAGDGAAALAAATIAGHVLAAADGVLADGRALRSRWAPRLAELVFRGPTGAGPAPPEAPVRVRP